MKLIAIMKLVLKDMIIKLIFNKTINSKIKVI